MAQTVRDVMTPPPIEVSPHAYVTDVARRMRDEDIRPMLAYGVGAAVGDPVREDDASLTGCAGSG